MPSGELDERVQAVRILAATTQWQDEQRQMVPDCSAITRPINYSQRRWQALKRHGACYVLEAWGLAWVKLASTGMRA